MSADPELVTRLKALRASAGMTQHELAEAVGLTRTSIANIEAGRQGLTVESLAAVAKGLGVTVASLLGEGAAEGVSTALLATLAGQQRRVTEVLDDMAALLVDLAQASAETEKHVASLLSSIRARP